MDWYRIKDTEEAVNTGIEDILMQKNNYSLIEWPEKAIELLKMPYLWIEIQHEGAAERSLNIFLRDTH